jgi:hypothetical protein
VARSAASCARLMGRMTALVVLVVVLTSVSRRR